jgi:division protein CdvB (Snf7/Vps24/ESCRT-III family)
VSTIISKIINLFSPGTGQQEDFRSRVEQAIVKLELIMDKVGELRYRFESRFQELWGKIIDFVKSGNEERARVYAGEAAQLRSMIEVVKAVENLLLMTIERLKTVKDVRELAETLMAAGAGIEDIKEQTKNLFPGLAYMVEEVSKSVKALIVQTSFDGITHIDPIVVSNKALEILNEAMKQASAEVRKKFPEPPVEPVVKVAEAKRVKAPPTPANRRQRVRAEGKTIEDLLLEYIREHGGFLDVRDFVERYGYTRDEVLEALRRMAEKGLVTIV